MITRHLYFVLLCISLSMPAFAQNTVAIVPGCPTEADGSLSLLQWQRVVWGWFLWAAGLRSLGLPEQDILVEPQALHTDENIAYALRMLPADAGVIVASHSLQAPGGCDMVRAWSSHPCSTRVIDFGLVMPRIRAGLPTVRGTAQESWVPLRERERRIAEQLGVRPRPSSLVVYARGAFLRIFGKSQPPMLLPANQ
jgi:hypothetical protein